MLPSNINSLSVASALELVKLLPGDRINLDFNNFAIIPEPSALSLSTIASLLALSFRRRASVLAGAPTSPVMSTLPPASRLAQMSHV
jgi:hypothetical protein